LAVGLIGLLFYRLVDRRAVDASQFVKLDVLASHQLIHQADRLDDLGFFRSALSGRDQPWSVAQEQLLVAGTRLPLWQHGREEILV
jgi:hypothetical protein